MICFRTSQKIFFKTSHSSDLQIDRNYISKIGRRCISELDRYSSSEIGTRSVSELSKHIGSELDIMFQNYSDTVAQN